MITHSIAGLPRFSLACLLLFLASCTSIQTGSQTAPNAVLGRKSTFRFLPDRSMAAAAAVSNTAFWRGQIEQAILTELNRKGYRFFPNRQTDLLVAFHVVLSNNESVTTLNNYSGYQLTNAQAATTDLAKFQDPKHPGEAAEGVLVVDLIDAKKRELLWRGWAKTAVNANQNAAQRTALIQKVVGQVLAPFPKSVMSS